MNATSAYIPIAPSINIWKIIDLSYVFLFSFVQAASIAMETFIFISGFLGAYHVFQIYDSLGGKLKFIDAMMIYGRKLMRVLPLYYLVFFVGWFVTPRFGSGPTWYIYE